MGETCSYGRINSSASAAERALDAGQGVVRFAPAWVPLHFCTPGRRLGLHPHDYYPFGKGRGGIDERWLASTVRLDSVGTDVDPHEGLSLVVGTDDDIIPFDEFVRELGANLLGPVWERFRGWPMYAKLFDNLHALPFHLHHPNDKAQLVGKRAKNEAYYFPPQLNNHLGTFPLTYFGLKPGVSRTDVRDRLASFSRGGDNRITELSAAHRLQLGTGWDVPAGVLHAPGSLCTYEPQSVSTVLAMTESWSNGQEVQSNLLWRDVPPPHIGDLDFILDLIDWDANLDPEFMRRHFTPPIETTASAAAGDQGYVERWITYRSSEFVAKELTVRPGASVTIREQDPYGLLVTAGAGTLNGRRVAATACVRFGALTIDEFFVSAAAASDGVCLTNDGAEDLVILKHFAGGNSELEATQLPAVP